MNTQLTDRPVTLPKLDTDRIEIVDHSSGSPRRWWIGGIAVAALSLGAVGLMITTADQPTSPSAVTSPVAESSGIVSANLADGPNSDLAPDWTCQRSPLLPACGATDGLQRPTDGPNVDLAPDWSTTG